VRRGTQCSRTVPETQTEASEIPKQIADGLAPALKRIRRKKKGSKTQRIRTAAPCFVGRHDVTLGDPRRAFLLVVLGLLESTTLPLTFLLTRQPSLSSIRAHPGPFWAGKLRPRAFTGLLPSGIADSVAPEALCVWFAYLCAHF
jgi:hypothetical protein